MPDDTAKVHVYLTLGDKLTWARNEDSALVFLDNGIALSRQLHYDSGVLTGMIARAQVLTELREKKRKADLDDRVEFVRYNQEFDVVLAYVRIRGNDREIAFTYKTLGKCFQRTSYNSPLQLPLYHSALLYYRKGNDVWGESEVLDLIGDAYFATKQLERAKLAYEQSIAVMQGKNRPNLSGVYAHLGDVYRNSDRDYIKALKVYWHAYTLAEKEDTTARWFAHINHRLGQTYCHLGDYEFGERYVARAVAVYEKHSQLVPNDFLYSVFTLAPLMARRDPKEAIAFLQRIDRDHPHVRTAVGYTAAITVNLLDAYLSLKEYDTASTYHAEVMAWMQQNKYFAAGIHYSVARFFLAMKQYPAAREQVLLYEQKSKGYKDWTAVSKTQQMLFKIDSAQHKLLAAMEHYQRYKAADDSMRDERVENESKRMEIEFETAKKEQALVVLTKDAEIRNQELQKAETRSKAIVAGLMVVVVVLLLLFYLYRLKTKTSEALRTQRDEIEKKNATLEKLVREKEWLLKEVHHRVKNNLHIVAGLLGSQSRYLKDGAAMTAIRDSQNRVQSISLIHQRLYKTSDMTVIRMQEYIYELVEQLRDSFNADSGILFERDVAALDLDVSMAVPLGLILNEAITNSIKYAFPSGTGKISILLHALDCEQWQLTIKDNGVGFPEDLDLRTADSLGLNLLRGLSGDIDGDMLMRNDGGAVVTVVFPVSAEVDA